MCDFIFTERVAGMWNSLPPSIVDFSSLLLFKKLLIMCMLTYLQDIDRLSVYAVCNFALSLSLFFT